MQEPLMHEKFQISLMHENFSVIALNAWDPPDTPPPPPGGGGDTFPYVIGH